MCRLIHAGEVLALATTCCLAVSAQSFAQRDAASGPGTLTAGANGFVPPQLTAHDRNVIRFFRRESRDAALESMPRRPAIADQAPRFPRPAAKPFQSVGQQPTVSPYLSLYLNEDDTAIPNYYSFVRPQLQQLEANRQQQYDLQRLQREVQRLSMPGAGSRSGNGSIRATGVSSRFMNTGHFYESWQ